MRDRGIDHTNIEGSSIAELAPDYSSACQLQGHASCVHWYRRARQALLAQSDWPNRRGVEGTTQKEQAMNVGQSGRKLTLLAITGLCRAAVAHPVSAAKMSYKKALEQASDPSRPWFGGKGYVFSDHRTYDTIRHREIPLGGYATSRPSCFARVRLATEQASASRGSSLKSR